MAEDLSRQKLEAMHCWEADDHVPRRPAMTEFRRRLRYHQARWREANGHPVGSQPIAPRPDDGLRDSSGAASRSPTPERRARTSSPHAHSTRRGPEFPSSSRTWRWGRLVVVHPAGNTDYADACSGYRALLVDQSTFSSVTVEEFLDANVLPAQTTAALRDRYLPS